MFISNATETEGILQFINCSWFNNYGRYSPAIDLSPTRFQQSNQGYLPIPLFKDIIVIDNHVLKPKHIICDNTDELTYYEILLCLWK